MDDCHGTRGQEEWTKKCISQFSLYAELVGDTRVTDPLDQLEAFESGQFKPKLTKSTKKRLRRKKRTQSVMEIVKTKVQMKRKLVQKKQTKKDLKKVIKKLSKMPL